MQRIYLLIVVIFLFATAKAQPILYVDSSRAVSGAGTSWATAFKELRDAFAYLKQNPQYAEIRVAKGTYRPSAVGNQDTCFLVAGHGVKIYGGYPSGGNGVRDAAMNPTVLSGDLGIDANGNWYGKSYHVLLALHIPLAERFILDGLTIADGETDNGADSWKTYDGQSINRVSGAGVFLYRLNVPVTINDCLFYRNTNGFPGSGLTIIGGGSGFSSFNVTGCRFQENNASDGGGVYIDSSSTNLRFLDCNFSGNVAASGAGMFIQSSNSIVVTGCHFLSGYVDREGGGIFAAEATGLTITGCLFQENGAGDDYSGSLIGGAAIANEGSSPAIRNCVFYKNMSVFGGAVLNHQSVLHKSNPTFVNSVFFANSAVKSGGVMHNRSQSSPVLSNCIVWNNTAARNATILDSLGSSTAITYSLMQGGYTGTGNINANPRFFNVADADGADNVFGTADDGLSLQESSPAINRGDNASLPSGTSMDVTGSPRIQAGRVDMGAYESSVITSVVYVDNHRLSSGGGFSWGTAYRELRDAVRSAMNDDRVDSILVTKGTYKPTNNTSRDSAFVISRAVKIYGGYSFGGGVRNPSLNASVLSGDIGFVPNAADNSYHVLVIAGIPDTEDSLVIDGFTISDGYATGSDTKTYGGQTLNQDDGAGVSLASVANKTVFRNCIFSTNTATGNGGAISNVGASTVFINCLMASNKADVGGGMFNSVSSPVLINCTLANNIANTRGGGLHSTNSSPAVTNSIIWLNTAPASAGIGYSIGAPIVTYSIVQAGYAGTANLATDPLFINAAAGNYGLQQCSPANNAGNSAAVPANITTDFAGNSRFFNGYADIGAYENVLLPTVFTFNKNGNWTVPTSWQCNWVPPANLAAGSEIIVDPIGGDCILNIPFMLPAGTTLTVRTGKKLIQR